MSLVSGALAGRYSPLLATVLVGIGVNFLTNLVEDLATDGWSTPLARLLNLLPGRTSERLVDSKPGAVGTSQAVVLRFVLVLLYGGLTLIGALAGWNAKPDLDFTIIDPGPSESSDETTTTSEQAALPANEPDLASIEVLAPATVGWREKTWMYVDSPDGTPVRWESFGNQFDSRETWIQLTEMSPSTVTLFIGDEDGDQRVEKIEVTAIARAETDAACSLANSEEITEFIALSRPTTIFNGFLNECQYTDGTVVVDVSWHRGLAANAYALYSERTVGLEPVPGGESQIWIQNEQDLIRILVVDDDQGERRGIGITATGPVEQREVLDLAEFLLERSGPAASRIASSEVSYPTVGVAFPCALLTADEMTAIVGSPLIAGPTSGGDNTCTYETPGTVETPVSILVGRYDAKQAPVSLDDITSPNSPAAEELPGVGDRSEIVVFTESAAIIVEDGAEGVYIQVDAASGVLDHRDVAIAVGQAVQDRLRRS